MKFEELFEFDANAYAMEMSQRETSRLRQQEIIKTRQIMKVQGELIGSAVADVVGAPVTGGINSLAPVYTGRQGDVAEAKLKIIQAELIQRGILLHTPDDDDDKAAAKGIITGDVAGDIVSDGYLASLPEESVAHALGERAAQHIASDTLAEYTDKLPNSTWRD